MTKQSESPPPGSFAKLMATELPTVPSPTLAGTSKKKGTKKPLKIATTKPRHRDITASRYQATTVETVRKAVRGFGKEAATHRFTQEEKKAIADIIYSYGRQGIRTSENQVTRISVNFILKDYKENGANSVLERVLRALNR